MNVRIGHRLIHRLLTRLILIGKASGVFLIRINHRPEFGFFMGGDINGVNLTDTACAE
ncbi:hypothetical protein D3C73_1599780 [compost metagenome]